MTPAATTGESGAAAMVRATINGVACEVPAGTRLLDYLRGRGVDVDRIAVERGRRLVPQRDRADLVIDDGDVFEVVQFVGGG